MEYIIPGKTFLLGEYSALVGGSALGLATGPGFKINYLQNKSSIFPFSEKSPAGLLWNKNKTHFENLTICMKDRFGNYGGFGKSTAEYLSVLIPLWQKKKSISFDDARTEYKKISQQSGAQVSGLDLAIQYFGDITFYDSIENQYSATKWIFKDYDFILVSTGKKIKTHEHLQNLDLKSINHFPDISDAIIELYFKQQIQEFIQGLKEWSHFLNKSKLLISSSQELKEILEKDQDILCVKPCGALGADVLLVICELEKSRSVQAKMNELKLKVQATSLDLMSGIGFQLQKASVQNSESVYVD